MSLSILNSVASLTAENALSNTQAALQKTLAQLSTGLRINSGSDDAAGLSISTGMSANIAALTQSQQNASDGIGILQTADGALSQVENLLNRAVTLATQAASGTLTDTQRQSLDNEFSSIKDEISSIGGSTTFNGANLFFGQETTYKAVSNLSTCQFISPLNANTAMSAGNTITVCDKNGTVLASYTYQNGQSAASGVLALTGGNLTGYVNAKGQLEVESNDGSQISVSATGQLAGTFSGADRVWGAWVPGMTGSTTVYPSTVQVTDDQGNVLCSYTSSPGDTPSDVCAALNKNGVESNFSVSGEGIFGIFSTTKQGILVSATGTLAGTVGTDPFTAEAITTPASQVNTFISDGDSGSNISVQLGELDQSSIGFTAKVDLGNDKLTDAASAQAALLDIDNAITAVAADRGTIGAGVNRLLAAGSVMSAQAENLTAADDSIENADIGKTVANMTQYNVLQSTGMAALQQSNQAQQAVLKLIQ